MQNAKKKKKKKKKKIEKQFQFFKQLHIFRLSQKQLCKVSKQIGLQLREKLCTQYTYNQKSEACIMALGNHRKPGIKDVTPPAPPPAKKKTTKKQKKKKKKKNNKKNNIVVRRLPEGLIEEENTLSILKI